MPIDPSIALGVRPVHIPVNIQSPIDRYERMQSMHALMQQSELRDMAMQQQRQQMQEQEGLARLYSNYYQNGQPGTPGTMGNMPTPGDILRVAPRSGMGVIKQQNEMLRAQTEQQIKGYEQQIKGVDAQHAKYSRMADLAAGITDEPSKTAALAAADAEKLITPEERDRLLAKPFDPRDYEKFQTQSLDAKGRLEKARADVTAKQQATTFEHTQRLAELNDAAQSVQLLTDIRQFPAWLQQQGAQAQKMYAGLNGITDLNQLKTIVNMGAVKPEIGATVPLPQSVQEQKIATSAAQGLAAARVKQDVEEKDLAALADIVVANPKLLQGMTGEIQSRLGPILSRRGFTQFEGKPTAGEETVAAYAARIKQANPILDAIEQGIGERTWNDLNLPEFLKTDKGKQFQQAERNFINSVLRRESGAAISASEFTEARRQYIPQPGDSDDVKKQKRENRLIVQQNLIRSAGPAYVDPEQLLREAGAPPAATAPAAAPQAKPAGAGPPPKKYDVMRGPDGKLYQLQTDDYKKRSDWVEYLPAPGYVFDEATRGVRLGR